ncbi:hypothetical protein NDU88_007515 [Pleurodeles waltl]|uniref:Uncharacterized protein n=1 Tax=Pleurodeles waltl TaxID=8319 RepID=A0AAV7NXL3_PLEWA|nr:hypothetical protein NDU88_007515 [Pleurodeles waltl]
MGATASTRAVTMRELKHVEDSLGPLEAETVLHVLQAQILQDARAEHAELLERLHEKAPRESTIGAKHVSAVRSKVYKSLSKMDINKCP